MIRSLALFLSLALGLPVAPVFALRNQTTEGAGLEEQLTQALQDNDPVKAVKTAVSRFAQLAVPLKMSPTPPVVATGMEESRSKNLRLTKKAKGWSNPIVSEANSEVRQQFDAITTGIYPEAVIQNLQLRKYNPVVIGYEHVDRYGGDLSDLPAVKALFEELHRANPKRRINVGFEIIPPIQLQYIKDFLADEKEYYRSGKIRGVRPDATRVRNLESYRLKLERNHAENLALWLLENGFDVVPIDSQDVKEWIARDETEYGEQEGLEWLPLRAAGRYRPTYTAIRRNIHHLRVIDEKRPEIIAAGYFHALKFDLLLDRDGSRSFYFIKAPFSLKDALQIWESVHREYRSAAGLEEKPRLVAITGEYGRTHAKVLTAMDAVEPVWQEEGVWDEGRWSMDVRPSTGTPLRDVFELSFAVENPQGEPVAYIYTTNGQPDYPVTSRYPGAFIFRLSVRQDQKGRRLGPLLLLASARAAKGRGIGPYVTLETEEGNVHARHVYELLGFQNVGTRREDKKGVTFIEYAVLAEALILKAEALLNRTPSSETEAGTKEGLASLQRRLQSSEVTGGRGIRGRFLTGEGDSYDLLVKKAFPHKLIPTLGNGLSSLLAQVEAESDHRIGWRWVDAAGGLGVALREAAQLFPHMQPVLIDAVKWGPQHFSDPTALQKLSGEARARGIGDPFSKEGMEFIEGDVSTVRIPDPKKPPVPVLTMFQALAYNKDPLGLLVHLYNQLPVGGILLANLYIPSEHPKAVALKEFWERILSQLGEYGVDVDYKFTDYTKEPGIDAEQTIGWPEFHFGIVLQKKIPGTLTLLLKANAEPFKIRTTREVTYEVASYEGDLRHPFVLHAAGLEELKDRLSQVQDPNERALAEAIYDTVAAQLDPARSLEQNLRGAVQAAAETQSQRPQVPFAWTRVGTKGNQAFIAFEAGQTPIAMWFDRGQVRDVTLQQEATHQLSYTALLGGQVGPKEFSEEFKRHHPDEPTDFAITYTTGQILDQLLKRNGRVTLVLTSKPGKPEDNKKEVAERFAHGWVGRYDGNDPMTFLWMVPDRVDIYFDEPSDPGPKLRKRLADAGMTVKGVFATPEQVGEAMAEEILKEWQEKDTANGQYVFGLVTGSTPKPFLAALMPRLRALLPAIRSGLLQRLQIVVPDDHVDKDVAGHYQNITRAHPVSAYTTRENDFIQPANEALPTGLSGMSINQVMVPEVGKVDAQLQALPGIDRYFLTFGPQHVFMQFSGEADDVKLYDPQELIPGKRVVVIQNSAEPAGVFGQIPASLRLPVHVIRADDPKKGRLIPSDPADWDWENVAALIVMGGPPNVHENSTYPWLDDLTSMLRYTTEHQIPTLGVCLGCQLLAHAVGGEVTQEEVTGYDQEGKPIKKLLTPNAPRGIEKGFVSAAVTQAGQGHPFLSGFRPQFNVAELHGGTIYFPPGATFQLADGTLAPIQLLLQGDQVLWQAFAIGEKAIGVLGHLEANPEIFDEWLQVPDNEEDEAFIRQMKRLFVKNEAYQKRQELAAQNWWELVKESWQQRSSAGLEEITSRVKAVNLVLVKLLLESQKQKVSAAEFPTFIQRTVGPYLQEWRDRKEDPFGFGNAIAESGLSIQEVFQFLLVLTRPEVAQIGGRGIFAWAMALMDGFRFRSSILQQPYSDLNDEEILVNTNRGFKETMAAFHRVAPFKLPDEVGLPIVRAARQILGLSAAGMEEESPEAIAPVLGITVEELGPIAEVLELAPAQFLRLARIIQLPIRPGESLPFFKRGGFLLHRPAGERTEVERYYVQSFTDYDGGSGYAWVPVERLNPTSQDEQIYRDIQLNGDEPDVYVYIPPIPAGLEEIGERIVVMNQLSSLLGDAMMSTWYKEERPTFPQIASERVAQEPGLREQMAHTGLSLEDYFYLIHGSRTPPITMSHVEEILVMLGPLIFDTAPSRESPGQRIGIPISEDQTLSVLRTAHSLGVPGPGLRGRVEIDDETFLQFIRRGKEIAELAPSAGLEEPPVSQTPFARGQGLVERLAAYNVRVWQGLVQADDPSRVASDKRVVPLVERPEGMEFTLEIPMNFPAIQAIPVNVPEQFTLWVQPTLKDAVPAQWGVKVEILPERPEEARTMLREKVRAGDLVLLDKRNYAPSVHRSWKTVLTEEARQGLWVAATELSTMDRDEFAITLQILRNSGEVLPAVGPEQEIEGTQHRFIYA